jgi:hypothetical protein
LSATTFAIAAIEEIRAATSEELSWIGRQPNPDVMAQIAKVEIESALTATSRPRQWTPVDVEEALLR